MKKFCFLFPVVSASGRLDSRRGLGTEGLPSARGAAQPVLTGEAGRGGSSRHLVCFGEPGPSRVGVQGRERKSRGGRGPGGEPRLRRGNLLGAEFPPSSLGGGVRSGGHRCLAASGPPLPFPPARRLSGFLVPWKGQADRGARVHPRSNPGGPAV